MKTTIEIPYTQDELLELFDYNQFKGVIKWRKRDRKWFNCDRVHKMWNNMYSDKHAGSQTDFKHKSHILLYGVHYLTCRIIYKMVYGIEPEEIYHIDGDHRNIKIENLVNLTHKQVQILNWRIR